MATYTTRDGCTLHYDIVGDGPPIALTPGGREGREGLEPFTGLLAEKVRVLTWDRRNTGQSDVFFGGEKSEAEIWADDLAELIRALDFQPAAIVGGSAGCMVSLLTALRHPDLAKALVLWLATGGEYACQVLGEYYHAPYIAAAQRGGMAAVAQTPFFAERISANPGNLERLLAIPPDRFIDTLRRWRTFYNYRADCPTIGVTEAQLETIATPTLIFEGNDDIHPSEASTKTAALIPGATLEPPAWTRDEFVTLFNKPNPAAILELYPRIVSRVLDFVCAET